MNYRRSSREDEQELLALIHGGEETSAEFDLGPDVFSAQPVLDLVTPCAVVWTTTLLAIDSDGLELGESAGKLAFDTYITEHSLDGQTWKAAIPNTSDWFHDAPYIGGPLRVTNQSWAWCARYLRPTVHFIDGGTFGPYEGEAHPTATFRFDVQATLPGTWL